MAERDPEQSRVLRVKVLFTVAFVAVQPWILGAAVLALSEPAGNDPTDPAINESAWRAPLLYWCLGPLLFLRSTGEGQHRFIRVCLQIGWAYAWVLCLLHVAIAFHLGHGWSHEAAWRHTRDVGGYGDGIFVNYAFVFVWLVDVIWLCVAFDSYFARPRWLHWTVHGFLAFVVFNAAVVFGSWNMRATLAAVTLILLALVWWARGVPPANPNARDITDIDAK
jgi:hypothetical protein